MTGAELASLLDRLAPDLDVLDEPWTIIGSAALILVGVDWDDCPDLDILTTATGAEMLEETWGIWRSEAYAPDPEAPFRSRFSRYDFEPGAVEVMGDLDVLTAQGWTRLEVPVSRSHEFGGRTWPAPDLTAQAKIMRLFGRPEDLAKAALLEAGADQG